ncbi:MAG: hypothetical protein LBH27_01985, partial [Endomicrobium sp.]|nr:hypothetical protein [Endomicrobium sp.]
MINLRILSFGLEVNADTVEYSDKNGINLLAKNNVIIKLKNKKIYADSINFSTKEKNVTAHGNIKIEEPKKNSIYFDNASYNYDDKNVRINDFFWHYSSIFVHAKFVNGNINLDDTDSNVYDVDNIIFSNCDLDNPHVYFKAKKGRIIPNKMIKVHDVFLYINGIPVFYFPVFIKFLNENHFFNKFKIKPIIPFYDGNKLSLMTMFSYDINKFSTGQIIFDLFGRIRNCLIMCESENTDGLFRIDNDVNNEKFEMYFGYFKVINDFLNMRSKMEICFNNDDNLNNYNAEYFADPYISLISENKDVNLNILFSFIQQNHDINLIYNINNVSDFITNFEKMFLIVPSMNFTYY